MRHRFVNILMTLILLSMTFLSNFTPVRAAPASEGITTSAEMESFLDGVINEQMKTNHIPGVTVSVVKDGETFFAKGYGYSNVADQLPVSTDRTLFRIGSVTKLFVATAVMQLVEQGKLDLDADVNSYLDFQIPATYSEPITLKNLLTHTPGFEESNIGMFVYNPEQLTSLGDFLKTHIPARVFPPGKVAAYSNYGAALAGYIVERVSGMPLTDYMEKNIFQPLGMNHSTPRQPLPADLAPDMAVGYNFADGQYIAGKFELVQGWPAGAISATGDDMAKFMIAHLQNGSHNGARILSEDTAQLMHNPHPYDPNFKDGMAYGFVWKHTNGQLELWHNGGTFLFHTGLHLLPEQSVGFFISANGTGAANLEDDVFQAFMDHYFPFQSQTPTPPADMASRAAQYTGEYYSSRSNFTGIEKVINLLSPVAISVDSEGYVLFSGERKYVEVEPGVLQGLQNPWQRIVLKTDEGGQIYLLSGGAALIKAAWYQTQAFHLSVLGLSLLVLIITLIGWTIASITRRVKKVQPQPQLPRLAHASGVIFTVLLIAFLVGLVALLSSTPPAFGVPWFLLEVSTGLPYVLAIPFVMVVAGIGMLVFAVLSWVKRFWNLGGRLHYTLLTISAWAMIFELVCWNFLKF